MLVARDDRKIIQRGSVVDKRLKTTGLGEGATYTDEKHDRY